MCLSIYVQKLMCKKKPSFFKKLGFSLQVKFQKIEDLLSTQAEVRSGVHDRPQKYRARRSPKRPMRAGAKRQCGSNHVTTWRLRPTPPAAKSRRCSTQSPDLSRHCYCDVRWC